MKKNENQKPATKSGELKLIHVIPAYKPAYVYGGPTLSASRLCESLVAAGARVTVLTTTANGREELAVHPGQVYELDNVSVRYFRRLTGDHSHFSPELLFALWHQVRHVDAVHIHAWWNLVSIGAVLVCWLRGVRPVLSPRGMLSDYGQAHSNARVKTVFQRLIGRFLLRQTVIHATAEQELEEARRIVPDWRAFIAPNIIDLPVEGRYAVPPVDTKTELLEMIFLSRIHHKKGLDLLFPALAALDFPWQLRIVGDGKPEYLAELRCQAQRLGIEENIIWHGWAVGEERYQLLVAADLYVLPSRNENFANAVLEALSVGTPVLVSDQVGMGEYVAKRQVGWVLPLEGKKWITVLENIYQATDERRQIRERAPRLIYEHFSAVAVATRYLEAYVKHFAGARR